MRIIQIVPRLPPEVDGVGDYAYSLAQQMCRDFDIQTHFIVCDPNWNSVLDVDGFPVSKIQQYSATQLHSLLNQQRSHSVLLHYVGYGYAKRGCPSWLLKGLISWKSNHRETNLVTMFHEISASGPIWTSSFWLSSRQLKLAKELARLSDSLFTSRELYAKTLQRLSGDRHSKLVTLPVFSSIGEPPITPLLKKRQRNVVVFGGKAKRLRVYQQSLPALQNACNQLKIKKIIDIGPPLDLDLSKLTGFPVSQMGYQSSDEISKTLSNSIAGFLAYNPSFLAKSTIFASYCAHRMVPVNALSSDQTIDFIVPGKHYCAADLVHSEAERISDMQAIADNAFNWYQNHNLRQQGNFFSVCFQ